MGGTLMPSVWFTALDSAGVTIPSSRIFFYSTGTTTKINAYTDAALSVAHPNPLTVDAASRVVVYLSPTQYKVVWAPPGSDDPPASPYKTVDPVGAVPATNVNLDIQITAGEALTAGRPVYLSDGLDGNTAGLWYEATATTGLKSTAPLKVGFPVANISAAAVGAVRLSGRVTGLSGLTTGAEYSVDTSGGLAITNSTSTPNRMVGEADSATSLVMAAERVDAVKQVTAVTAVVGNVGAGEDALFTYTTAANDLWAQAMAWSGRAWGFTANNANAKTLRLRLADGVNDVAVIEFALTASETGRWVMNFNVMRLAATTFVAQATVHVGPGNGPVSRSGSGMFGAGSPGLCTFANAGSLRITAEATTTNDVTIVGGIFYREGLGF